MAVTGTRVADTVDLLPAADPENVLYVGGGAMKGAYAAGNLHRLAEEGLQERIDVVYAESAGIPSAAYFLADQPGAVDIYFGPLCDGFIDTSVGTLLRGIGERLLRGADVHDHPEDAVQIMDVDRALHIFEQQRPLDVEQLQAQDTPLYASLLEVCTGQQVYRDIRDDPLQGIKAGICRPPYYSGSVEIDGRRYVDGMTARHLDFSQLRERHPSAQIIVLDNYTADDLERAGRLLEAPVIARMQEDWSFSDVWTFLEGKGKQHMASREAAAEDDNAHLVHPETSISRATTDPDEVRAVYEEGRADGEEIARLLEP